jgi:hypothetical protein
LQEPLQVDGETDAAADLRDLDDVGQPVRQHVGVAGHIGRPRISMTAMRAACEMSAVSSNLAAPTGGWRR